jgi:hypothetical protein
MPTLLVRTDYLAGGLRIALPELRAELAPKVFSVLGCQRKSKYARTLIGKHDACPRTLEAGVSGHQHPLALPKSRVDA